VRQKDDSRLQEILSRLLYNTLTDEDIELLQSRVISDTLRPPEDAIVIVGDNKSRQAINQAQYARAVEMHADHKLHARETPNDHSASIRKCFLQSYQVPKLKVWSVA
jgi:hypothetical protein